MGGSKESKGKRGGKKADKPRSVEEPQEGTVQEAPTGHSDQIFDGPIYVMDYGTTKIKMVGYRNGNVEYWGMVSGYRCGPQTPGSVNRTMQMPAGVPEMTSAVQFALWALPILQANNPGATFDWEMANITSL